MRLHQFAHLEAAALQVEQQVDDDLAGAVVGDLAAAVDLHDRDADVAQQVFGLAGQAQREHRRVLAEPEFVRRVGVARGGEVLHRAPGRLVVDQPEPAITIDAHSTTLTSGCAVSSRYSASSCAFEVARMVQVRRQVVAGLRGPHFHASAASKSGAWRSTTSSHGLGEAVAALRP